MRLIGFLSCTALVATLAAGPARAEVHMCQAGKLTCPTTMPVGGFCECTARGATQDGTVVKKAPPHQKVNSTAGGCGVQPGQPGCR